MITIFVQASMPEELVQEFMQMVRDFDSKHDPEHTDKITIFMTSDMSQESIEDVVAGLRELTPSLTVWEQDK